MGIFHSEVLVFLATLLSTPCLIKSIQKGCAACVHLICSQERRGAGSRPGMAIKGEQQPLRILFFPFLTPGHLIPAADMAALFAARGVSAPSSPPL